MQAALEGAHAFDAKRERVDEYGWRNFGDLYADHEAVQHAGHEPLVSHYNNQYDAIAGFAMQFMRTGDRRWWRIDGRSRRAHVRDIDVYHTTDDKAAYNGGLFWHTHHYTDAGTSTHRTYPRETTRGGGPSAEHNYTTGLMLHYYLTGQHGFARDGRRAGASGCWRWTTATRRCSMAGAKRDRAWQLLPVSPFTTAPAAALPTQSSRCLNAWRLTGDRRFLAKAEELIRRCIHPRDDVEALNLLDAETPLVLHRCFCRRSGYT